jgi:hypothetical protein
MGFVDDFMKVVSGITPEEFFYVSNKKSGAVNEHGLIPLECFLSYGNLGTVTTNDYRMRITSLSLLYTLIERFINMQSKTCAKIFNIG